MNVRFIRPMDQALLERLALTHRIFITMEENVHSGGFGEHVDAFCAEQELPVQMINIAIPNMYVEHGSVDKLKHVISIDAEGALRQIHNALDVYKRQMPGWWNLSWQSAVGQDW